MNIPNLRHFTPDGIYSDPVEALVGEAWVPAIYTDKGWATADGVSLPADIAEWRHAVEAGQTPKASRSNRAVKSRQVTQG
jgi:hypothetical protein